MTIIEGMTSVMSIIKRISKEDLIEYIKSIIVNMKTYYDIALQGFYKIYAYQSNYGLILKIFITLRGSST